MDLRLWQRLWKDKVMKEQSAMSVLASLWDALPELDTPLGRLAQTLTVEDVPSGDAVPKTRGDDLLPIDLDGVADFLGRDYDPDQARAVLLIVLTLNYLWLGGRDSKFYMRKKEKLTQAQELSVAHLAERVRNLASVPASCSGFEVSKNQLVEAKFEYAGEPIMALEELRADLVIPIWPKVGEAAVQAVEPYLPEQMKQQIQQPELSLLSVNGREFLPKAELWRRRQSGMPLLPLLPQELLVD